jgi:hypothetical protein
MQLTTATELDIPEIIDLWKELMDFHNDVHPNFPMRKDAHATFEKHLREMMNSEDARVLIMVDEGRVIAYSIPVVAKYNPLWERERYGMIDDLAVTSEW